MKNIGLIIVVFGLIYSPVLLASESTIHCFVQVGPKGNKTENGSLQTVREIILEKSFIPSSLGESILAGGDSRFTYEVKFNDGRFRMMEITDVVSGHISGTGPTRKRNDGTEISLYMRPNWIGIRSEVTKGAGNNEEYGNLVCMGETLYKKLGNEFKKTR